MPFWIESLYVKNISPRYKYRIMVHGFLHSTRLATCGSFDSSDRLPGFAVMSCLDNGLGGILCSAMVMTQQLLSNTPAWCGDVWEVVLVRSAT